MTFKPKGVAVVGLGLIGGSIGLALKARTQFRVCGFDLDNATVRKAYEIGAIDSHIQELKDIGSQADLIFIATPIAETIRTIKSLMPFLSSGTIMTDVASVKSEIVSYLEGEFLNSGVSFIAGHPMAGKETQGIDSADQDLFEGRAWILVPGTNIPKVAYNALENVITIIGAKPILLDAQTHDEAIAAVSHLPFLVARMLFGTVAESPLWEVSRRLAAGGFRDSTRLASGNPQLHTDIVCANREQILLALDCLEKNMKNMRTLLESGTRESIMDFFQENKNLRDQWYEENYR